jgi:hypothetical protein
VTNQRVVFHGGRKTLEFPFPKLATLNAYRDGIELGVTSRQTTSRFRGVDGEYMAAMIKAMFVAVEKQTAEESASPKRHGPPADIPGEIGKLADLRDRGILTEEEFASKKAELLARM